MTDDRRAHLFEVLTEFSSAMLVTHGEDGEIHARPMAVGELGPDATLRFATSIDSAKIDEIEGNPACCVTFQSGSRFASLIGSARLNRDRGEIARLWSPICEIWFPKGKDDPDIVVIEVDPVEGAYWDNSGLNGLAYMFEAAKAALTGAKPKPDQDRHAKLRL